MTGFTRPQVVKQLDDWRHYFHSYHLGIYLAANAIPDCFVAFDGPDCLNRKMEWVHITHDMRSTLVDPSGEHRIVTTLLSADNVIKSQGDELIRRIRRIARIPGAGLVLVNSMPHVTIIGTQYDKVIAEVAPLVDIPVVEVPSRSLSGDWVSGYADTLEALASELDIEGHETAPSRVAIIGHLMDRNEADQVANVAELERLVGGAGAECVSVWLSGRPTAHLLEAGRAGTLIALPHGRKAAAVIAKRTGATVLELDLPLGLSASRALVAGVADAAGTRPEAEAFWSAEIAEATPRIEWAVQRFLVGLRVAFAGDPAWLSPLATTLEEVGASLVYAAAPGKKPIWAPDVISSPSGRKLVPTWGTHRKRIWVDIVEALGDAPGVLIADSVIGTGPTHGNWLPLGFPCSERHALFESPFLGVRGWLWLMQQLLDLRLNPRPTPAAVGAQVPQKV